MSKVSLNTAFLHQLAMPLKHVHLRYGACGIRSLVFTNTEKKKKAFFFLRRKKKNWQKKT